MVDPEPAGGELASTTDQELIRLHQQGSPVAAPALFARYRDFIRHQVAWHARHFHLPADDLQDAHQEAVLAFYKALERYSPDLLGGTKPRPFRAYLWLVLHTHLLNYIRQVQRSQKQAQGAPDIHWVFESALHRVQQVLGHPQALDTEQSDPLALAEARELWQLVGEVIDQLGGPMREIWNGLIAGESKLAVAKALDLPYKRVLRF